MTELLPSWPTTPSSCGSVVLREFTDEDAHHLEVASGMRHMSGLALPLVWLTGIQGL